MREWLYALVLEVLLMLEVKSEMGKWEMNTFSIGFPYFSTFAFVFLSSFSTKMVFKKINKAFNFDGGRNANSDKKCGGFGRGT